MKNNLFNYATSELSQDAFLCWLASYALEDAEPDAALRACAKEMLELFVPELKGRPFTLENVERQVGHIDVLLTAELEGTIYKIIVEDKTYTREHSNQLARYMKEVQEKYPTCIPCGVYYKTGFQSDLSAVSEAKYQYVSLEMMLNLFRPYVEKTNSQIFRDYISRTCAAVSGTPPGAMEQRQMLLLFRCAAKQRFFEGAVRLDRLRLCGQSIGRIPGNLAGTGK